MGPTPTMIRPTPGSPLGAGGLRRRPVGRIRPTDLAPGELAADHDACFLDGRPVTDWQSVVAAGRLAAVEGAFALAWRDAAGTIHLARDGIGERTLFYAALPDRLAFASSVADLLPCVPRKLNLPAVAAYLSYAYLPGRETLVEGVYEVLPGEHVTWRDGYLFRTPFWELPAEAPTTADEADLTSELRRRLETAVRRRLPADGPVGATLSGGVDSSLVVALAKRLHPGPVLTYSVSFGADYPNELAFSSLVADHCGTDHHVVELSPPTVLHYLDDSVGLLSDPIGDPLTVPNALLFREAARQVGVVLNGEGGDPTFGGPKNLPMLLAELQPALSGNTSREANYLRAHLKCYDDLPEMLTDEVKSALAAAPLEAALEPLLNDPRWPDFVSRLQAINIRLKGGHHILPKVDALSAPFGVLPRAPLFDRSVVEFSLAVPPRLKLHGSTEKYLLKRAVADLLPAAILDRPKSGMLVPVEGWFRGPLLPAAKERVLDGLAPYGLFRRDYLERLLAGRLGGLRPRHGAKVWLLVTLEAWLRRVFKKD
jgi:asparagine synthase (glutamine-hydrolysing)